MTSREAGAESEDSLNAIVARLSYALFDLPDGEVSAIVELVEMITDGIRSERLAAQSGVPKHTEGADI